MKYMVSNYVPVLDSASTNFVMAQTIATESLPHERTLLITLNDLANFQVFRTHELTFYDIMDRSNVSNRVSKLSAHHRHVDL